MTHHISRKRLPTSSCLPYDLKDPPLIVFNLAENFPNHTAADERQQRHLHQYQQFFSQKLSWSPEPLPSRVQITFETFNWIGSSVLEVRGSNYPRHTLHMVVTR